MKIFFNFITRKIISLSHTHNEWYFITNYIFCSDIADSYEASVLSVGQARVPATTVKAHAYSWVSEQR